MNKHALNTLEYNKIKEELKKFAISTSGQDLIEALHPSDDIDRIKNQLLETSEAKEIINKTSSIPLKNLMGIELIMNKLGKGTALHPEDLSNLADLLRNTKRLKKFMEDKSMLAPTICNYAYSMFDLSDVIEEIDQCIINNRVIDSATPLLDKIRKKIYVVENRIKTKLENIIKSPNYKKYLQNTVVSIKNDRYVISVKSEYKKQIPGTIIDKSSTGLTLFIEPASIGKLHNELNVLKIDEEKEEYQVLLTLTLLVESYIREITINIETLSYYDFIFAKAKYSKAINGSPVEVNFNGYTKIVKGRHPMLGSECMPLDFEIGNDYSALVITGPNTGGKTVTIKTVGLFTAMVQSGLHVPVSSGSHFAIFSDILVDIGDGQSIEQSLSTFSSHIKNIIEIINAATKYSLVILDEIGAGTDPTEGEGLAIAILKELQAKKATIIATSHFSEVKNFASSQKGFKNGKMEFNIDTLKPIYKLTIGKPGESNAFIIALRLGMNKKIIEDAHMITYNEKKEYSSYLEDTNKGAMKLQASSNKAKRPKSMVRQKRDNGKNGIKYNIGDIVFIHSLKQRGTIYAEENKKEELGVMVNNKKMNIHKKRISPFIEAKHLYPENYDFDIVFKSKEYRKKNKLMSRKYVKDLTIELEDE